MHVDSGLEHHHGAQLPPHLRERDIGTLATSQHGVVAHRQLLALGFSDREIGRRVAARRLRPWFRGVYAVGHDALSTHGRWKAATLACGDDALLSHRSGVSLWRCLPPGAARIDVSVPAHCDMGRGFGDLRVHQRSVLLPADRTVIDGIPVTSLARTLLDFAGANARRAVLLEALEQSVTLRVFDLATFADLLDRSRGQRGTRRLCAALELLTDDPGLLRSELERRLRELVLSSSLPRALVNHHVPGSSGRLHECDLVFAGARLIVEADGDAYHSKRSQKERDARKQADLEAAGWLVERLSWGDVVRRPAETLVRLRTACESGVAHRSGA